MTEAPSSESVIKSVTPVAPVYRQSINEAAKNLPPVEGYKKELPTDAEVLGKKTIPTTSETTKELPETINEVIEEEEIVEEEKIIEPIKPDPNVDADKAKKEIVSEKKLDEFELENEEDVNFLKELYKKDTTESTDEIVDKSDKKVSKVAEIDLEEKYKPYKEKAAEYDTILSNPMAKAFLEYLKSGKNDPNEFAKEAGFVNLEALTPEQLMEIDFKSEGLTSEEIAQELEAFEALSPYEKKKRSNSVKAEQIQKRDEKLKTFTAGSEKVQQVHQQAVKQGMSQLNELIPKMEGKKYKALLITPEMANSIKQHVISHPEPAFNEQGQFVGYDIKESINTAVLKLYSEERDRALVELGKSLGADKALTARIRPNKKVATSAVIPVQQKSFEDVVKKQSDAAWAKRQVKPLDKK